MCALNPLIWRASAGPKPLLFPQIKTHFYSLKVKAPPFRICGLYLLIQWTLKSSICGCWRAKLATEILSSRKSKPWFSPSKWYCITPSFSRSKPVAAQGSCCLLFLLSWTLDRLGQIEYNVYNRWTWSKELLDNQQFFALYERRPEKEDCLFKPR